jgi:hypothetical protein
MTMDTMWMGNGGIPLPEFDTHVLKRVLKLESEVNDPLPLSEEQIESDVLAYLGFLREHKANPGRDLLPSVRVDRVWHIHILQTADYARVCQEYVGYFLHHASLICGAGQVKVHPWHYRGERDDTEVYAH